MADDDDTMADDDDAANDDDAMNDDDEANDDDAANDDDGTGHGPAAPSGQGGEQPERSAASQLGCACTQAEAPPRSALAWTPGLALLLRRRRRGRSVRRPR